MALLLLNLGPSRILAQDGHSHSPQSQSTPWPAFRLFNALGKHCTMRDCAAAIAGPASSRTWRGPRKQGLPRLRNGCGACWNSLSVTASHFPGEQLKEIIIGDIFMPRTAISTRASPQWCAWTRRGSETSCANTMAPEGAVRLPDHRSPERKSQASIASAPDVHPGGRVPRLTSGGTFHRRSALSNLSPEPDDYFSDGLTEEIIHALSSMRGIRRGRANLLFRLEAQECGRPRGRPHVECRFRARRERPISGHALRATVQLVSTSDGYPIVVPPLRARQSMTCSPSRRR